uniref:Retrotransposon gag domain-containing protein n=1 Tax=Chromera velia CCMP2878 TaxID=1169474 RepID=A0A0G4FVG3_9ALVE|eukprot:Cvel_18947.t1-p1 / transcript=Cvel_18947.t1 / gene=Cvel_18947 / organism=Chromera_velia_CCMP2878 / gene_product=hypothetical protein / transcript_product=hypothetical protein / location=Cvel_scaffold1601:11466-11942(-) / protein_length=159 / sequence_SO=supercontig / SO=protein_coding / is_pseudo=false
MFLARYGIDEREAERKKRTLLQMTQNFGETSSEYITHFEEQCSAANQSTDDPTALATFIEGIEDDQICIQMESHTYETFEELQVNLRKWEDMVKKWKNRKALAIRKGDRPVKRLRIAVIEGGEEGSPPNRNTTQALSAPPVTEEMVWRMVSSAALTISE